MIKGIPIKLSTQLTTSFFRKSVQETRLFSTSQCVFSLDKLYPLPPKKTYIPEQVVTRAPSENINILDALTSITESSFSEENRPSLRIPLGESVNLFKYDFQVTIQASRNNTLITFCNRNGQIQFRTSAGTWYVLSILSSLYSGLKKAARGTSDAGYQAGLQCVQKAIQKGIVRPTVHIKLNGFGPGRDQAFKALISGDWHVRRISDVTPIRFGGCRAKKKRRL